MSGKSVGFVGLSTVTRTDKKSSSFAFSLRSSIGKSQNFVIPKCLFSLCGNCRDLFCSSIKKIREACTETLRILRTVRAVSKPVDRCVYSGRCQATEVLNCSARTFPAPTFFSKDTISERFLCILRGFGAGKSLKIMSLQTLHPNSMKKSETVNPFTCLNLIKRQHVIRLTNSLSMRWLVVLHLEGLPSLVATPVAHQCNLNQNL